MGIHVDGSNTGKPTDELPLYLPAAAEIRTATDEYMGNLPGVERFTMMARPGETILEQEITLAPGAIIPIHYHVKRFVEVYFWMAGTGVVILEGKEYVLAEQGLPRISIKRGRRHGLRNDSKEPFTFLVMYNNNVGSQADTYLV